MDTVPDRLEKRVMLRAPRARVWRALTDATEFGAWFGMRLAAPFTEGARIRGQITTPGYEHLTLELVVERIVPQQSFAYRWHPHEVDLSRDYSAEPMTLVEFTLEDAPGGTWLTIVESGFDRVPLTRRAQAFRANDQGWTEQGDNLARHVAA